MKFRKGMNVSFVLVPIIMFSISIPLFYLSYTTKDLNNTKKVLQEAAYTGALAGSYALDINSFEKGMEGGVKVDVYPTDKETGNPVAFMIQNKEKVRKGDVINERDCLKGDVGSRPNGSSDLAAMEAIQAAEMYLKENLNINSSKTPSSLDDKQYSEGDYSIAVKFSREDIKYDDKNDTKSSSAAPYNKIEVSVSLRYKPIMYKNLFKDSNGKPAPVPIYGTSSAKTKTIS